jgi:hypothetical protein
MFFNWLSNNFLIDEILCVCDMSKEWQPRRKRGSSIHCGDEKAWTKHRSALKAENAANDVNKGTDDDHNDEHGDQ